MWAVEMTPDTLLVKGVQLTSVDGISDDGEYARLVLMIVEGYRNDNVDGEPQAVPMLLRSDTIGRLVAGLTNVAEPTTSLDPGRKMFTEWILSCRENMTTEPADSTRKAVDTALTLAGDAMGFNVSDRSTVEAMLFGIAASQAVHVALTDKTPDNEGFGDSIVGALGLFIDALSRRLPGLGSPS